MTSKKPKDPHNFKEVGDYYVKDSLGEGVNGAVKLGVHKKDGIKVALKFVSKVELTPKQNDRLQREIRFLTLLYHPNIVRLYNIFEYNEYYVFAMERVRKGELLKFITSNGYLQENKFRGLFRQILSAVNYCHQNSIVHRDLKPENILMDDNKNTKIIDFGLSNLFDEEHYLTTFCGSPKYAAPEIITGTKYIGPGVDMWSLGVILFAALTGKLPFNGRTVEATYSKVLSGIVKYPSHLSQSARDYIARFLIINPEDRITMKEAMTDPWILEGYGNPPETHLLPRPETIPEPNQEVFQQLLDYNYLPHEVNEALNNPEANPIKNTYFLLLEKKDRDQVINTEPVREKFSLSSFLTHSLKSRKNKFDKDGFLLDITYITERILRMTYPMETVESLFLNPLKEVQKFFEKYHKDHYKIYNLSNAQTHTYSHDKFHQVTRIPVPDQGVPSLLSLKEICEDIDKYLSEAPDNVVAIHGKQDIVRPAMVICAYLIHSDLSDSVDEAIAYFLDKMYPGDNPKQIFTPSMKRYLRYYHAFKNSGFKQVPEKIFCISSIEISPVPNFDIYNGCDPAVKIKMNGPVMVNVKKTGANRHYNSKKDTSIRIPCDTVPMSNDIFISFRDKDPLSAEEMFCLFFHLSFLDEFSLVASDSTVDVIEHDQEVLDEFVVIDQTETTRGASIASRFSIVLPKNQLDIDKRLSDKFPDNFSITITFTEPKLNQKAYVETNSSFSLSNALSNV